MKKDNEQTVAKYFEAAKIAHNSAKSGYFPKTQAEFRALISHLHISTRFIDGGTICGFMISKRNIGTYWNIEKHPNVPTIEDARKIVVEMQKIYFDSKLRHKNDVKPVMQQMNLDMPTDKEISENLDLTISLKQFHEGINVIHLDTQCIGVNGVYVSADSIGIHKFERSFILNLHITEYPLGPIATHRIPDNCTKIHIKSQYIEPAADQVSEITEITFS